MVMAIRKRRMEAGMDQASFAAQVGVAQSTVSEWEKENYLPKARQLPLVAYVLGCTIDDLFEPMALEAV